MAHPERGGGISSRVEPGAGENTAGIRGEETSSPSSRNRDDTASLGRTPRVRWISILPCSGSSRSRATHPGFLSPAASVRQAIPRPGNRRRPKPAPSSGSPGCPTECSTPRPAREPLLRSGRLLHQAPRYPRPSQEERLATIRSLVSMVCVPLHAHDSLSDPGCFLEGQYTGHRQRTQRAAGQKSAHARTLRLFQPFRFRTLNRRDSTGPHPPSLAVASIAHPARNALLLRFRGSARADRIAVGRPPPAASPRPPAGRPRALCRSRRQTLP